MAKSFSKLRGRICEKYGTVIAFAEQTSKSRTSVSNKLSGDTDFSREDMIEWGNLLGIAPEEYGVYFFEDKV